MKKCDFGSVAPEEFIRDRSQLVFGISDEAGRKKLLGKSDLSLEQTDEICHSADRSSPTPAKAMEHFEVDKAETVHALSRAKVPKER